MSVVGFRGGSGSDLAYCFFLPSRVVSVSPLPVIPSAMGPFRWHRGYLWFPFIFLVRYRAHAFWSLICNFVWSLFLDGRG